MNINPALRQTLELAALVQPHCAATGAVPGDELNFGRVCAGVMVHSHLQPQPFRAGLKIDACRPVRRVPGGEQVVRTFLHKSGVTRAHQRFGVRRRRRAVQVPAA